MAVMCAKHRGLCLAPCESRGPGVGKCSQRECGRAGSAGATRRRQPGLALSPKPWELSRKAPRAQRASGPRVHAELRLSCARSVTCLHYDAASRQSSGRDGNARQGRKTRTVAQQ